MTGPNKQVANRYTLRVGAFMGAYVILLAIAVRWFRGSAPPEGVLRYAVALAPALPVIGVIWAMGAYLMELKDEYQRLKLAVACLWATGLTMAVCTGWGFLQNFAGVGGPPLYSVFIIFMIFLAVVQVTTYVLGRRS